MRTRFKVWYFMFVNSTLLLHKTAQKSDGAFLKRLSHGRKKGSWAGHPGSQCKIWGQLPDLSPDPRNPPLGGAPTSLVSKLEPNTGWAAGKPTARQGPDACSLTTARTGYTLTLARVLSGDSSVTTHVPCPVRYLTWTSWIPMTKNKPQSREITSPLQPFAEVLCYCFPIWSAILLFLFPVF